MNLNKSFVLGNLTQTPEKKALPSGLPVTSFGVATNRFYTDQNQEKKQDTEFHNIVLFGRSAEIACQYLQKGSLVLIEGRLRTRNWQDSAGVKHYKTEIIGEKMQLGPRTGERRDNTEQWERVKEKNIAVNKDDIPVIEEISENEIAENNFNKDEKINIEEIPF
ncbi:single-stranded DNA-binding protein [Patescibacteria group bacterium]|nr:single-stranded DNA-binding protein [Patescibacteria group bacterium]